MPWIWCATASSEAATIALAAGFTSQMDSVGGSRFLAIFRLEVGNMWLVD
jgi:hypothetical protein